MAVTEYRGRALIVAFAVLKRLTTSENVDRILALSPTCGPLLTSNTISRDGWYSLELYAEFTRAMHQVLGPDISKRMGRETTIADVNSLFRFVLHVFSPESLARFAPRIFAVYFKGPHAVIERADSRLIRCCYEGFSGASRGIYEEFTTATGTFLELGGGRNVQVHIIDGGRDGDSWVRFDVTRS